MGSRRNGYNFIKRLAVILAAGVFALLPAGCGRARGSAGTSKSYMIYYLNQEQDQIQTVEFTPIDTAPEALLTELAAAQQKVPEDDGLIPLLPEGTTILNYALEDGTLTLDLDASYTGLSPTREILTRAGLVRTFAQVDGVSRVVFRAGGEPLRDSAGNEIGPLRVTSFLENAGKEINTYQRATMTLYFADETGTRLVPERRTVYYTSNEPLERVVVEELIRGPGAGSGHYPVLPSEASLLGVTTQDRMCYVNFESSFSSALMNASEEVQVWAVVDSLTENCSVDHVQFSIGGESKIMFREEIPLDQTFERNTELIAED